MSKGLINRNGTLVAPDRAQVSVFDRSFLYGDSLYEVIRTYGGRPFALDEHLDRLFASARLASMSIEQSRELLMEEIRRTIAEFLRREPGREVYCRIVVSRGSGRIGFGRACLETPSDFTIYAQSLTPPTESEYQRGYRLLISNRLRNDPRALDPAMKSGNYLNSVLAYLEAETLGFSDAVLCNHEGFVTEGTTFNVWYVKRGILVTPPLSAGILEGITRRKILELAQELDIEAREVDFTPDRLIAADEVFLTSTIREVFPVTGVNAKKISRGKPGPITVKLTEAFRSWIQKSF